MEYTYFGRMLLDGHRPRTSGTEGSEDDNANAMTLEGIYPTSSSIKPVSLMSCNLASYLDSWYT